ncbi:hypothetical protein PVAP13_1NG349019 [Panicum virgatum]|uniref:Uncharacterized protein n=1 Tax=Panicum virgatum TaxID=38727 RepID=A0A8T0X156_PANVG|nr:hypothetical protein PVAP13_1NG349019 [Panicum virgatum]
MSAPSIYELALPLTKDKRIPFKRCLDCLIDSVPAKLLGTPTVPCSVHLQTYDDRKDAVSLQQGLIVPGPYGVRLPLPLKSEYAHAYVLFKVETSMSSRNSNAAMNISGV